MSTSKIAITLQRETLKRLDRLVKGRVYPSRSRAIQAAVEEKIARIEQNQLARECDKLDPLEEKSLAEEGISQELEQWPEY
jgi:metal-responsive CopG/Arc/MetJ family transcriptional regulator